MKGRLAIFLPSVDGGGAEKVMVLLANRFAALGYEVDLVLAKAEGAYVGQVSAMVNVVDLNASRVLLSVPSLVRYLRRAKPDAMLSALAHANIAAIVARRFSGVRFRLVVSERANLSLAVSTARTFRARQLAKFVSRVYPLADHVIAVSQGVADDLVACHGLSPKQVTAVYNPVVDDNLIKESWSPLNDAWFSDDTVPVVLGVGRLVPPKDFAMLVRAIARVRAEIPVRLVILGEGDLRAELQALVASLGLEDDVKLAGFKENPFAYMRNASLFVLSSMREGLPGALIQAMACGTPVVSTQCPDGPLEILEGGRWGRLVPVGDDQAMAVAIRDTLDDISHPQVEVRAQDFTVDAAVANYLDLLLPNGGGGSE